MKINVQELKFVRYKMLENKIKFQKIDIYSLISILLIFAIDRFSKVYVINAIQLKGSDIFLYDFLNLTLNWNRGIAFGLLSYNANLSYHEYILSVSSISSNFFSKELKKSSIKTKIDITSKDNASNKFSIGFYNGYEVSTADSYLSNMSYYADFLGKISNFRIYFLKTVFYPSFLILLF